MSELLYIPSVIETYTSKITKFRDANKRLEETRKAVFLNLATGLYEKIVLVDGSNTDILTMNEIRNIENKGILVEQLKFQQPIKLVEKYGASFGEMTINDHMIRNSNLANEHGTFIKLSGRYNLVNSLEVVSKLKDLKTFFVNYHPFILRNFFPFTSTIFYKSSIDFYNKYLADCAEECSYEKNGFLESVYFRRLNKIKKSFLSIPYPYFSGYVGGGGMAYNDHLIKRKVLSRMRFLSFTCD